MRFEKIMYTLCAVGLLTGVGSVALAEPGHHADKMTATEKKSAIKPIVAVVEASWCPACQKIAPTLQQVMKKNVTQVDWVVFDISSKESAQKAAAQAKAMELDAFFKKYGTKTATVAIIHPETKKVLKVLMAESREAKYAEALKAAHAAI